MARLLRLALLLAMGIAPGKAGAQDLVAALSDPLIAITTAFAGTTVVLFGTTKEGSDIAVTVQGPRTDTTVRRKERIAGIWLNTEEVAFRNAPTFYAVASSKPLGEIADPDVLARHELGVDHLGLEPLGVERREISEIESFRDALIRNKQRRELYSSKPGVVTFIGGSLFRTSIGFPAHVPPGLYEVEVFQLEDGSVTGAQRSTLVISKVGFEADIFDFAQQRPALYGIVAILIALASGWVAGVMFRRG